MICKNIFIVTCVALLAGCTEPGRTTEMGAAAGGALGAGLGAGVGAHTGSTGGGLVLGALAGGAAGGAIGNGLEAGEKKLDARDEKITRQDEKINSQKNEIQELKKMNNDNSSFKNAPYGNIGNTASNFGSGTWSGGAARHANANEISEARARLRTGESTTSIAARTPIRSASTYEPARSAALPVQNAKPASSGIVEKDLTPPTDVSSENTAAKSLGTGVTDITTVSASDKTSATSDATTGDSAVAAVSATDEGASNCAAAEQEASKSSEASEPADRLFHMRRALRMCPESSDLHNRLGELYLSMKGKKDDAKFEFQEALKLDPSLNSAKANLASLSATSGAPHAENGRY